MLKMKNIIILLILIFFVYSCEKVIDVDLNDADPEIVIEGNLSNIPNKAEVKISMTSSFFDTLPSEMISGAKVTIKSEFGDSFVLTETSKGIYNSKDSWFGEGTRYQLIVEVDGEEYISESKLNRAVGIDSIRFYYEDNPFLEKGYYINIYLLDPPGIKNFYRLKYAKNGVYQNTIDDLVLFNDRYIDGNTIEVTLFNQPLELNDTITLQLISLDEGAYEYLRTFQELVNSNPGSAAPANPVSNISNGALGYFSAWSSNTKSAIIKIEE